MRLKSRSLWLKSRDRNTSYFHKQYQARLNHNHISEISSSNGETLNDISQIKQAAEVHFQSLFKEDGEINYDLSTEFMSNVTSLVSEEENGELMNPFTKRSFMLYGLWS